jgi:hypothetical protein
MVKLDKDLREEIDSRQASVDGSVYASFCLYLSGLVFIMYCIYLPLNVASLKYISSSLWSAVVAFTLLLAGFVLYRLSLLAHSQFGVLFKAIFDQYRHLCDFSDIVREVDEVIADPHKGFMNFKEKNLKVWRYLRWNLFRPPGADKNYRCRSS